MKNVRLYCCTINYFKVLDVLPDYILPVGLGNNNFPENWLTEKKGENISSLNPYYAEFTMFYWIWKNKLRDLGENDFIGTCQHRWLWLNEFYKKKQRFSFGSLYSKLLNPQNEIFEKNDLIHLNPHFFSNINLKEDFRDCHDIDFLMESISYLPQTEKKGFEEHLAGNAIYPNNMFITKVKYFKEYCTLIFPWLEKCYKFGLDKNLYNGYNKRLIAFLMERFSSYWFQRFKNKNQLSYCRLGKIHLSNRINKFVPTIKMPLSFLQYPTLHKF